MGGIKYMPAVITVFTIIYMVFGFEGIYVILFSWGIPPAIALALDIFILSFILMFLIGLGSNKKQFIIAAGLMGFAIFFLILVFS